MFFLIMFCALFQNTQENTVANSLVQYVFDALSGDKKDGQVFFLEIIVCDREAWHKATRKIRAASLTNTAEKITSIAMLHINQFFLTLHIFLLDASLRWHDLLDCRVDLQPHRNENQINPRDNKSSAI